MALELSSPVRSEGHGSSADHGGREQKNLTRMHRHTRLPTQMHPPPRPGGTLEDWLTSP
jgi:hypothetical protein